MKTYTGNYHYEWDVLNFMNSCNPGQVKESPVFPEAKSNASSVSDYRWKMSVQPNLNLPPSPNRNEVHSQVANVKSLLFKLINVVASGSSPIEDVWVKYSLSITSKQAGQEIGSTLDEVYKLGEQPHSKNIKLLSNIEFQSSYYNNYSTPTLRDIKFGITIDTLSFRLREIPPENVNFYINKFANSLCCTLDDPLYSDIKIHVGEVEIKAHRVILSAMSAVFAAMMEHEFVEKNSGRIVISDFDADVVRTFLCYIYGGYVTIANYEMAENLLKISDRYAVEGLKQLSCNFLSSNITISNFADVFLLAEMYQLSSLKADATDFFVLQTQAIITSTSFARIESENPSLLTELLKKLVTYEQIKLRTREQLLNKK